MVEDAEKFLELLTEGEPSTFQTFDETKAKRKTLNKVLHGRLTDQAEKLESLNQSGAGIFVMVNAGDLKGRKAVNVRRVRAAFVDLDGSPIDPVLKAPLPPHIVVESSPKRFHAYWLTDGISNQEFRPVQEMLARRYDADLRVKDLPRVMRLPGFLHQKREPYLTHILQTSNQERFDRDEFYHAFDFDPAAVTDWKDKAPILEGHRNNKLFSMARGFVNKGYEYRSIFDRICKTNESRCNPPLPEAEVEEIVRQSLKCVAGGALTLDYKVIDSPLYKGLSPLAKVLDMAARRLTNGNPNAVFPLLAGDLERWGIGDRKTISKYRDELLDKGFLKLERVFRCGQAGMSRDTYLFRLGTPDLGTPDLYGKIYHKGT